MRNAWMVGLALMGVGLTACDSPTTMTGSDAGTDSGFIPLNDGGVDTGPGHDAAPPVDANIPPYDGGPAFSCTGLTAVTPDDYCAAFADTYVAVYTRCGLLGTAGATELRAALIAGCDVSDLAASVTAGTTTWDADMAACCLGHSAHDTSCFLNIGSGAAECDFIHGTVANGGACNLNAECMDGYCHVENACPGVCTPYADTGTACGLGDVVCAPDADCDATTRRCTTQTGTAGTTCSTATDTGCLPTLTCYDPENDGTGMCMELPTRGDTCDSNTILCDLNSSICDYDYATESGYCVPALELGSMRCIIDAQCTGDAYCQGASFAGMVYGTCTARAERGDACGMAGAPSKCVDGLVCLPNHTCGDAPTLGESCTPATGCDGARCSTGSGTCIDLLAAGQHCTANNQCASGNCIATTMTCAVTCP